MDRKTDEDKNEILKIHNITLQTTKLSEDLSLSTISIPKNILVPLHSHQGWVPHEISSGNTSFRLLNVTESNVKKIDKSDDVDRSKKVYAFGSSELRKVSQFQAGPCTENLLRSKGNGIKIIAGMNFAEDLKQKNQYEAPKIEQPPVWKQRGIGFGIGEVLKNGYIQTYSKLSPGPGSYTFEPRSTFTKGVKINPKESKKDENSQKDSNYKYYDLPSPFESQISKINAKKQLRCKYEEKKVQNTQILSLLNSMQKINVIPLEGIQETNEQEYNTYKYKKKTSPNHKSSFTKNHTKPYRLQLRDKTNSLLPRILEEPSKFQTEKRDLPYKYLASNCFRIKNDHAYEAHSYKFPQQESEYIFIKGKNRKLSEQHGNSCFMSDVKRQLF